ncbi:hypothetical protein OJE16_21025 [Pantoea tagorei]
MEKSTVFFARRGNTDGGNGGVKLTVGDGGQDRGEVLSDEIHLLDAHAVRHVFKELHVEAGELAAGVGEGIGFGVTHAGDAQVTRLQQPPGVVVAGRQRAERERTECDCCATEGAQVNWRFHSSSVFAG